MKNSKFYGVCKANSQAKTCSVLGGMLAALLAFGFVLAGCSDAGGGKVFYVSTAGFTVTGGTYSGTYHYLEAAPADMSTTLEWASSGYDSTYITGIQTGIGTGAANTAAILATDIAAPAAKACDTYINNGKNDWFLPSKDELNEMYMNRTAIGGFTSGWYWSSSQYDSDNAWPQRFSDGHCTSCDKDLNSFYVRAVRAF